MSNESRSLRARPRDSQMAPKAKLASLDASKTEMLGNLMRERLAGFLLGQLYNFQDSVPPEREQFLWFDFGLLLSLLTSDFELPSDAEKCWSSIILAPVREYIPGVTEVGLATLLAAARGYRDRWMEHWPDDSPLAEVLAFAMLAAFNCSDADTEYRGRIVGLAAGKTLDDCTAFVNAYISIVGVEPGRR